MAGSFMSGTFSAAAENESASSEALIVSTVAPSEFLISIEVKTASPLDATKDSFNGPRSASSVWSTVPVIEAVLPAPPASANTSKSLARI